MGISRLHAFLILISPSSTKKRNSLTLDTSVFASVFQGVPFPQNEANAMDVVIQFAVHKLGFQLNDIVVYAWSIGGFTGRPILFKKKKNLTCHFNRNTRTLSAGLFLVFNCPVLG